MTKIAKLEKNLEEQIAQYDANMLFQQSEYDADEAEQGGYSNYSYWRSTWRSFTKNRTAIFFMCVLGVLLLFTLVQPLLPDQKDPTLIFWVDSMPDMNHRPDAQFGSEPTPPGRTCGRVSGRYADVPRNRHIVGLFDALLGIIIGAIWGYVRKLDRLMTEIYTSSTTYPQHHTDPGFLHGEAQRRDDDIRHVRLRLAPMSRFVRNQIVIIRDQEYNLASRCLGTPTFRMIMKNLLPYLISVIMLRIALAIPAAIGNEVFLTYIGLGLPVTIPSLGILIKEGRIVMLRESYRYLIVLT